ncbi:Trypsin [Planctomycetes bacterium MalM25]|nr:Trypsin [Planctomycetes bacterium MalM25]
MPSLRILAALTVLLGAVHAFAIGRHNESITPESEYLAYAENFPSVGWMFGYLDETPETFSSGVLIDPHWVLTSGHGVEESGSFYDSYLFGFGANSSTEAEHYQSSDQVYLHPEYSGPESGVDLALLYFETPFSVEPATIYEGQAEVGEIASIVGYGQTGTPSTGAQTADGVKRAAQNILDAVDTRDFGYFGYRFRNTIFPDFLPLGGQGMPGDSGGGWFLKSDDDEFYLAGISSGGSQTPRYGADTSAYAIYRSMDWITSTIASVSPSIPGDYDGNGLVEQADYDTWEMSYGEFGVALAADGNLDGRVDAADYAVWRDAFGVLAVSVPEPSTLTLFGLASIAWLGLARRELSYAAVLILLASLGQPSQAGLMHNDSTTPESAYLEYANQFPSTGWMFTQENGEDVAFSSGVLIDRHWVLTSGHGMVSDDSDRNSTYDAYQPVDFCWSIVRMSQSRAAVSSWAS